MHTLHSNTQTTLLLQFSDDYFPSQTLTLIQPEQDLFRGFGVVADIQPRFNIPQHDARYTLVNSCNGFICLRSKSNSRPRVVCNPVTGEYVNLPEVQTGVKALSIGCGLGFCSNTKTFKVLQVFRVVNKDSADFLTQIHSVGSSSWRLIGNAPFCPSGNLVSVHGFLHWIDKLSDPKIMSFDFESESFNEIPLPCEFEKSNRRLKYNMTIGVLNMFLVGCCAFRRNWYEIWKMMEYGNRESWSKLLDFGILGSCFSSQGLQWPLTCLENGDIVMVSNENIVFCYDFENENTRFFKFRGVDVQFCAVSYTPSFQSLVDFVGDGVEVLNLRPRLAREEQGGVNDSNLVEYYRTSATHKQVVPKDFFKNVRVANMIKQWEASAAAPCSSSSAHLDL